MIAIGAHDRWHLQLAQRWIVQYNFYINDRNWGRMFVRICPYLPFSARVCLNQHHWLANRMRSEGVDFKQCSNAFLRCAHPEKLQELADSLTPHDLLSCGQKWLACLTPFFKESERKTSICLVFLKLFERVYSPLTAGLLQPYRWHSLRSAPKTRRRCLCKCTKTCVLAKSAASFRLGSPKR